MTHATTIRIRPATAADLPRVAGIWHEAQSEDADQTPVAPEVPSLYLHELEHGELHVLERDGQVLAFGALLERGSVRFLADLFVARAERSSGLGRRLLRHLLGSSGESVCTISSPDPRALALYVRAGLRFVWPHLSGTLTGSRSDPSAPTLPNRPKRASTLPSSGHGRAAVARIAVTGPHPALGALLADGFRFGEVETFCATDDVSFVDVRRYISSSGDLF